MSPCQGEFLANMLDISNSGSQFRDKWNRKLITLH